MKIETLIEKYHNCNDRFTFDHLFRSLLHTGYSHEEAKDIILYNCSLSAMTFQERICNRFYKKIEQASLVSEDLEKLRTEIFRSIMPKN